MKFFGFQTSENIKLSLYKFLNIENEEDYNKIPLRNQLDHTLAVIWALFSNDFDESNLSKLISWSSLNRLLHRSYSLWTESSRYFFAAAIDQINVGLQFLKRICTNGRYSPEIERGIIKLESLLQLKQSDSNLNPIPLHVSRSTQTSSVKIKPGIDTIQAVKLNSYGNHLQNSLDFLFQKNISLQGNSPFTWFILWMRTFEVIRDVLKSSKPILRTLFITNRYRIDISYRITFFF